jgi:hypothetical protein
MPHWSELPMGFRDDVFMLLTKWADTNGWDDPGGDEVYDLTLRVCDRVALEIEAQVERYDWILRNLDPNRLDENCDFTIIVDPTFRTAG